jgi:hypothetical protein
MRLDEMTRDDLKREAWIVVLNDNHLFTGLTGCWIALTDQDQVKALDEGAHFYDVIEDDQNWDMQNLLEWAIDHGYFDDVIK